MLTSHRIELGLARSNSAFAAADLGLEVSRDLSIAGVDDVAMASYGHPALTSVALPTNEIGATAMRLTLELLATIRLPSRLVLRASSDSAPQSQEDVEAPAVSSRRPPQRLASCVNDRAGWA